METALAYEEFEERRDLFQEDCLDVLQTAREDGVTKGLIDIFTSGGKTNIAIEDVKRFLTEQPDARVLVLSHRKDLSEQLRIEFEKGIGPDRSYGRAFGGTLEDQEQFVFANFQTMTGGFAGAKRYEGFQQDEFDYILVDESHHAPANTYREVLDYFQPQFLLGLTATPDRHDAKDLLDIFDRVIYRKTVEEAWAEGLLTSARYKLYSDQLLEGGALDLGSVKLTLKQLERLFVIPRRDEEIAEIILDEATQTKDPYGLIFTSSIEHAESFARVMGDAAVPIHSQLSPSQQKEHRDAFFGKEVPFATTVGQFDEGIDLPTLNMLAFLRETLSHTRFMQRLGRGLRRHPEKDFVTFLDFTNSISHVTTVLDLEANVRHQQRSRLHQKGVLDPAIEFDFSTEARDIIGVIKAVRERTQAKARELEPFRLLKPAAPVKLEVPSNDSAKTKEIFQLTPLESFCLQQAFEDPIGTFQQGFIQEAHKHLFGKAILLGDLQGVLKGLEEADIVSLREDLGTGRGSMKLNRWRITSKGVEALAQVEPYHTAYQDALGGLHAQVSRYREAAAKQGRDPDNVRLKSDSEPKSTHLSVRPDGFVLQQPLGRQPLNSLDITSNEEQWLVETKRFRLFVKPDNYFMTERHEIGNSGVVFVRSIFEHGAGPGSISINRLLSAGEISELTKKVAAYEVR